MAELNGVWAVDRLSGALPPLYGCVKRINGTRGTTQFGSFPGMGFEVRGLELHYRPPFAMLVDKLEPQDGGYSLLTVVHDQLEGAPKTAASVSGAGWMMVLSGLKTVLETGEPLTSF